MTWLRFLNPGYVIGLEQKYHTLMGISQALARASKGLAVETAQLAIDDVAVMRRGEVELRDAQAERRTLLAAMEMVATEMARGRTGPAKDLVEGILFLLRARQL